MNLKNCTVTLTIFDEDIPYAFCLPLFIAYANLSIFILLFLRNPQQLKSQAKPLMSVCNVLKWSHSLTNWWYITATGTSS